MSFLTTKKYLVFSLLFVSMLIFVSCDSKKEETKEETKKVVLTPEAAVKECAEGLINAMSAGDMDKAQAFLTKAGADQMKNDIAKMGDSEKEMMVNIMKEMFKSVKIGAVTVEGEKATLKFTVAGFDGKESEEDMNFTKEDGAWKAALK